MPAPAFSSWTAAGAPGQSRRRRAASESVDDLDPDGRAMRMGARLESASGAIYKRRMQLPSFVRAVLIELSWAKARIRVVTVTLGIAALTDSLTAKAWSVADKAGQVYILKKSFDASSLTCFFFSFRINRENCELLAT